MNINEMITPPPLFFTKKRHLDKKFPGKFFSPHLCNLWCIWGAKKSIIGERTCCTSWTEIYRSWWLSIFTLYAVVISLINWDCLPDFSCSSDVLHQKKDVLGFLLATPAASVAINRLHLSKYSTWLGSRWEVISIGGPPVIRQNTINIHVFKRRWRKGQNKCSRHVCRGSKYTSSSVFWPDATSSLFLYKTQLSWCGHHLQVLSLSTGSGNPKVPLRTCAASWFLRWVNACSTNVMITLGGNA